MLFIVAMIVAASVALGVGWAVTTGGGTSGNVNTFPASYVIVYRVITNGVPQWEILAAERPFDGSDLTYKTAARPREGDVPAGGTISTATGLFTVHAGQVRLVSGRQPGPPSNDLHLAEELPDALARGLAVDTGSSRTIAGRTCHVYRFAEPPSGPIRALDNAVGHDDLCLDTAGLVLAETWTYHGSVVERRTATAVTVGGEWPASVSRPPSTMHAGPPAPGAAVVGRTRHPESFLAAPPAPAGYRLAGEPVDFRLPDPQALNRIVAATVVWAFQDGPRVITVEAGEERGGTLPWRPGDTATEEIPLPALGSASTALRSDGPEVRISVGAGRWVRVRGTVPVGTLVTYARGLHLGAGEPTAG